VAAAAGLLLAAALRDVRTAAGVERLWRGDTSAAQSLLQVVVTSVTAATSLTFSLTIVAVQLASQQFSPRLLRGFARDAVTKRVLVILLFTTTFALTLMSTLAAERPLPRPALVIALAAGVLSLVTLLVFISHLLRTLRVDTMMLHAHGAALAAITTFYPAHGDESRSDGSELRLDAGFAHVALATRSGFVQRTDVAQLLQVVERHDLLVRVEVRAGDHVVRGTPVASIWRSDGARSDASPTGEVLRAVKIHDERTLDQDAAFGFRQLEDIAVKAMSPAVNDPVTAVTVIGHMADLLVELTTCRLGAILHRPSTGGAGAIVPDRDLRYYLDLSCEQLARTASSEPTVLQALLGMLRDVAIACRDDEQRAEVERAACRVASRWEQRPHRDDDGGVDDMLRRVRLALTGRLDLAYADRAGEARSI